MIRKSIASGLLLFLTACGDPRTTIESQPTSRTIRETYTKALYVVEDLYPALRGIDILNSEYTPDSWRVENPKSTVTFDHRGRVNAVNGNRVDYDEHNRVIFWNGHRVGYDVEGRIHLINGEHIEYDQEGKIRAIGGKIITYDEKGKPFFDNNR